MDMTAFVRIAATTSAGVRGASVIWAVIVMLVVCLVALLLSG